MLIIANRMNQLSMEKLLTVYAQAICEKADTDYCREPEAEGIRLAQEDFIAYLRQVFFRTPGACYAVWEEGDCYYSALRLEPYKDGLLVSALETAPNSRRQGYGFMLLSSALEHCRGKVYSHVEKKNIASLKTHEKCGFSIVRDCAVYLDGSVSTRAYTLLLTCCQQ